MCQSQPRALPRLQLLPAQSGPVVSASGRDSDSGNGPTAAWSVALFLVFTVWQVVVRARRQQGHTQVALKEYELV